MFIREVIMFEGLGERLQKIIHKAKGYGKINEENI